MTALIIIISNELLFRRWWADLFGKHMLLYILTFKECYNIVENNTKLQCILLWGLQAIPTAVVLQSSLQSRTAKKLHIQYPRAAMHTYFFEIRV